MSARDETERVSADELEGALVERAHRLLEDSPGRVIIGIVGPPGAGKSTLTNRLLPLLPGSPVVAPMDGFHLAQVQLARLGLSDIKGAPETFDVHGYLALLRRVREESGTTVYAPSFHREIEEPIAGAIAVEPSNRLVFTEGNYLLHDGPIWSRVRRVLDEAWYIQVPEAVRRSRLIARHESFGRTHAAATAWVDHVDMRNATLVERGRLRADVLIEA